MKYDKLLFCITLFFALLFYIFIAIIFVKFEENKEQIQHLENKIELQDGLIEIIGVQK